MPVPHPRSSVALAPHVRGCMVDGQLLLLDLRNSRYLGLSGSHARALAPVVSSSQALEARGNSVQLSDEAWATITAPLITQGLLVECRVTPRQRTSAREALASLDEADADASRSPVRRATAREVWHFAMATTATALSLRTQSLQTVVHAVMRRRAKYRLQLLNEPTDALRNTVAVFDSLRPLAFTARDRCLFDSLALLHFLATQGLAVQWLIGVRTRPFGAHAWLQCGATVLNDQHEHVRRYTPILVV